MSERELTVEGAVENNFKVFMERGPGLSSLYRSYVDARDRARGVVLLGGLGGCGVGKMWFRDDGGFSNHVGYVDAEEVPYRDIAIGEKVGI